MCWAFKELQDKNAFWKCVSAFLGICTVVLSLSTITLALQQKQGRKEHSGLGMPISDSSAIIENYVWTKIGLEAIPLKDWRVFSGDKGLYIKNFPFPGDSFTKDHLAATPKTMDTLLAMGHIQERAEFEIEAMDQEPLSKVPVVFSDPIIIKESLIDYRLQFAMDIGSNDIGTSAANGRLVNPAGRRLREHFYRFPDQCDATPIALEVFLRLMIYDQIEAFFHQTKIGLWHDLFLNVERRDFNTEELSVARWYGERYAEGYVHQIRNGWVYPLGDIQNIDTYMLAVGLDPEDPTMDPNTPAGLGNLVGKKVTEWLAASDMLQKNRDFVDIEGLKRIADHHPTPGWNQWKPTYAGSSRFQGIRDGIVTQQTFVSPSLGIFSFLYKNEQDFLDLGLQSAVPKLNMSEEAYVARAKEFLNIQKNMTDHEKAVAELSNNKISGSIFLIRAFVPLLKNLTADTPELYARLYDEFSMVTSGCAEYAATHAAWRHKRTYLAGRPKSIIRHLAETNKEFAAEHPEAPSFEPMIPAGDHPEYPSGSSAIYSAFAQAGDDWFLEKFGFKDASKNTGSLTFEVPASKFYWTEGPSKDITLEYTNLNEWIEELPKSRVYGGVHFMDAGNAGVALGKKVGNACSKMLARLNAGDYQATYTNPARQAINPFNPSSME